MKTPSIVENLDEIIKNTLAEHLGIVLTEIGDDFVKGKMPVDHRTHQPAGILHGGASMAFAETLGSIGSFFVVKGSGKQIVGLEINGNHIRPVKTGFVYGLAKAVHLGKKTHIWKIDITNEAGKLVCTCRLTVMIIDPLA